MRPKWRAKTKNPQPLQVAGFQIMGAVGLEAKLQPITPILPLL